MAVEDADQPATSRAEMAELATYVGLLDETLRCRDARLTRFVVDAVEAEMRRLARAFPQGDAVRKAGLPDRNRELPLNYAAPEAALDAYHDPTERMVANYPRMRAAR